MCFLCCFAGKQRPFISALREFFVTPAGFSLYLPMLRCFLLFFSSIFNDCLENSHVNFYINVGLKNQRLVYSFTIPLDLYIKKDL